MLPSPRFTPRSRRALAPALAACALGAAAPVAVHAAEIMAPDDAAALCAPVRAGEHCGAGDGRTTAGGGSKVSHAGWPAVTGILWKVLDSGNHTKTGGAADDELLGHHGSDTIAGGPGYDIVWGDWDPDDNNGRQRDVLRGNAGDDWIYPSHGTTRVVAGPGADHIWPTTARGRSTAARARTPRACA